MRMPPVNNLLGLLTLAQLISFSNGYSFKVPHHATKRISSKIAVDRRKALSKFTIGSSGVLGGLLLGGGLNPALAQPAEFKNVDTQAPPPDGESPFQTLPNGVKIKDFRVKSEGPVVANGSKVGLTLKGRLLNLNGVVFYDTKANDPDGFGEGRPLAFTVGDGTALPGLESGLIGMQKGAIRRIIVPEELGYTKFPGLEPIPVNEIDKRALDSVIKNPRRDATLLFDVKLERVK